MTTDPWEDTHRAMLALGFECCQDCEEYFDSGKHLCCPTCADTYDGPGDAYYEGGGGRSLQENYERAWADKRAEEAR